MERSSEFEVRKVWFGGILEGSLELLEEDVDGFERVEEAIVKF